ncbi:hypothetical protein [Umezakia ovalisporum]|jgi:hypothetical protein|uniref:Uncharacterized protein n=2 Tax=Umezakia ovalisporum TaxID=75695 RepID=A0AA43GW59_9CYAN|nr:hypothetical protein [Umezakia ovalisporum]MBI1243135.1 hypothetical protein [Nostoc sp. RI_552]MDH6055482.1 hypothetical protein [Umezakia ovalisporum FSS-43]MDH6062812.1 hypothetical protein [Umezakia ovalisporum FSS-62]MDH6067525.1 hypothetical protein [Umezakia ovalisporum APH033B]MDH6070585.1 hypothetical protein [Umezakia ovalisporum CobakiLakeA]
MSNHKTSDSRNLSEQLQAIATAVYDIASLSQGDPIALLALLRHLEQLHRDIRDSAFQESLPDNRQKLYSLLRDIESQGGWPYIERMRLQTFLATLPRAAMEDPGHEEHSDDLLESDRSLSW